MRTPGFLSAACLAACLLVAGAATAPARAQDAPDAAGWRIADAVNAPDWLSVSGTIRPRLESLANTFVAGRTGDEHYFNVTTLLQTEARAGDFALGGELLDSRRISGQLDGGSAGEIDTIEPIQAYLAWRPNDVFTTGSTLDLTLGRFTLDIGSRRLVARPQFRSVQTSFTGAHGVWTHPGGSEISAFFMAPTLRRPSDPASAFDNETALNQDARHVRLAGLHVASPPLSDRAPGLVSGMVAEAYVFDLDEGSAADPPARNRQILTAGLRLKRPPGKNRLDIDLEWARQTGSIRSAAGTGSSAGRLDHAANMVHAEAGYTFDAPWTPRLSLHYDFATGDRNLADASSERFDPLYGDRSFEFGPTSLWGAVARTNLSSPGIRIEAKPTRRTDAYLSVRRIGLDQAADSFGNAGVRDPSGLSGADVGVQIEGRLRHWLVADNLRLEIGAAALLNGDFLREAPNATGGGDSYYGYTSMTFSF